MQSLTASRGPSPGASSRTIQVESMGRLSQSQEVTDISFAGHGGCDVTTSRYRTV
jgi:hypothetical protein